MVAYYRVSTQRQGASGLGLDGQRAAVAQYAKEQGDSIVREFTEIESGKNDARPQLVQALAYARRSKCILVVAKLDRLARSVAFVDSVMRSGVDFVAVDIPSANRMVLHILAAVAEAEADAISKRTKAALTAAKARGIPLGSHNPKVPHLTPEAIRKGAALGSQSGHDKAVRAYSDLVPMMRALRQQGLTLRAIALALNADEHKTRNGSNWTATQVLRVIERVA